MSKDKTGGPAFPHGPLGDSVTSEDGQTNHQIDAHPGMSLRDWFAGMAMQGFSANPSDTCLDWDFEMVSRLAYEQADRMLEARKKSQ